MARYKLEGLGWGSTDREVTVSELEAEYFGYYPNRDRSDFLHFLAKINSGQTDYIASMRVWKVEEKPDITFTKKEPTGCQHPRKYTNTAAGKAFVVCPDCKQEVV